MKSLRLFSAVLVLSFANAGCLLFATSTVDGDVDAGDGGSHDGGTPDAGSVRDGGDDVDSGVPDAGDAGAGDAGADDAGNGDAGDAGNLDAGDAGNLDAGDAGGAGNGDAGVLDAGPVPWADANLGHRMRLQLTADGAIMGQGDPARLSIDHVTMVTAGAADNGADLKLFFLDGQQEEVPFVLASESGWGQADTEIMIRLVEDIEENAVDDRYFLYFGDNVDGDGGVTSNADAGPALNVSASRVFSAERLEARNAGGNWTEMESLTFETFAQDQWIVVATWRQKRRNTTLSSNENSGSTRLTVNGVSVHSGLTALAEDSNQWRSMGSLRMLPQMNGMQEIKLEARILDLVGTSVDNARLVAFLVLGADTLVRNDDQEETVSDTTETVVSLDLNSFVEKDILVMASGAQSERPGNTGNRGLTVWTETGLAREESQTSRDSDIDTDDLKPLLHVHHIAQSQVTSVEIEHQALDAIASSKRSGVTLLAFDLGRFAAVHSLENQGTMVLTAGMDEVFLQAEIPSSNEPHRRVTFAIMDSQGTYGGVNWALRPVFSSVTFLNNTTELAKIEEEILDDRADGFEWGQTSLVSTERTKEPRSIVFSGRLGAQTNGMLLRNAYATVLVYPEIRTTMEAQEERP